MLEGPEPILMKRFDRRRVLQRGGFALLASAFSAPGDAGAQTPPRRTGAPPKTDDCNCTLGADRSPLDTGTSELRPVIERYDVELRNINRVYPIAGSPVRRSKIEGFYSDQLRLLDEIRFDILSQSG